MAHTWRLSGKLFAAARLLFSRLISRARTAGDAGCTFFSGDNWVPFCSEPWNRKNMRLIRAASSRLTSGLLPSVEHLSRDTRLQCINADKEGRLSPLSFTSRE